MFCFWRVKLHSPLGNEFSENEALIIVVVGVINDYLPFLWERFKQADLLCKRIEKLLFLELNFKCEY